MIRFNISFSSLQYSPDDFQLSAIYRGFYKSTILIRSVIEGLQFVFFLFNKVY